MIVHRTGGKFGRSERDGNPHWTAVGGGNAPICSLPTNLKEERKKFGPLARRGSIISSGCVRKHQKNKITAGLALSSILFSNGRSLDNKPDYIQLQQNTPRVYSAGWACLVSCRQKCRSRLVVVACVFPSNMEWCKNSVLLSSYYSFIASFTPRPCTVLFCKLFLLAHLHFMYCTGIL